MRMTKMKLIKFLIVIITIIATVPDYGIAQNKANKARPTGKIVVTKHTGKPGKNKKSVKRIDEDQDEKPNVIKLVRRTGEFVAGNPISQTSKSFGVTPALNKLPGVGEAVKDFDGEQVISDKENNEVEVDRTIPGSDEMILTDALANKSRQKFSVLSPQAMPGPALSFNGILSADLLTGFGTTSMPPDTVGDVGPNHYVQATNFGVFRIFNKSGAALTATANISTLFAGLPAGDTCRTRNDGDPVVNYDPMADRWVISQFYSVAPFGQCIAVSQTSDPTGAWYAYDFPSPNGNFADYPHWGVWTDGYYLSTHEFNAAGTAYIQGGFYAFNRNKMLVGDPTANYIYFSDVNSFGHLAADIDGYAPPAAGTAELFMEYDSAVFGGTDSLQVHEMVPNFTTPASSTFTLKTPLPVAAFDPRNPTGRADIEQPTVTAANYLDALGTNNMFRVAYRNLGTTAAPINSYVTNWTVNVSGVSPTTAATHQAAIRWEELRLSGAGALSVFDQGTHAPDPVSGTGRNRWMGSIAQDNQGNLALGFSRSGIGAADFPDIVWAGRTGGQVAAGTMNEGEATMHASTGIQSSGNRWGDYSAMSVDPTDDCTFWYTQEWREVINNGTGTNNQFKWSTRIANFKFPGCTAAPKGQIAANVTNCATGLPVVGASVLAQSGGFLRMTNAGGNLISNIIAAPGDYTLSAFRQGYTTSTTTGVTVTDGGIVNGNVCLGGGFTILELASTPAPTPVDENANGRLDPGETATLDVPIKNTGGLDATAVTATLSTTTPGVTILPPATKSYPDIPKETGTGTNTSPYKFKLANSFVCGSTINFTLTVNYNGTVAAQTFTFTVTTIPPFSVTTTLDTTVPPTAPEYTATTGTQTGRLARTGVASVCGTAKVNPGLTVATGARQYDAYTFTATTAGCVMVTLNSTNGAIIYGAAYNSAGFVPATPNVNYLADAGTSGTSVIFGFNVTAGQTFTVVVHDINVTPASGSNYTLSLSGPINRGCQTFAAPSPEADVASRPSGNGFVDLADVMQIRQFSVGSGLPYQSNEFQRTDCAPRSTSGDGFVDSDDIQQAIRYAAGNDGFQNPGGPSSAPPLFITSSSKAILQLPGKGLLKTINGPTAAPAIRIGSQTTSSGQQVIVPVLVDTAGNEAGYTFSVSYDNTALSNPVVTIGNSGGDVVSNVATAGQIGISVTNFAEGTIAVGTVKTLVNITFTTSGAPGTTTTTPVTLSDTLAKRKASGFDPNAPVTQPTYTDGNVVIVAPTAAGATITGKVLTANGRGIKNALLTLIDSTGKKFTTTTGSFGFYRFNDVASGGTTIIKVAAKRYSFANAVKVIGVNENIENLDFIALQ